VYDRLHPRRGLRPRRCTESHRCAPMEPECSHHGGRARNPHGGEVCLRGTQEQSTATKSGKPLLPNTTHSHCPSAHPAVQGRCTAGGTYAHTRSFIFHRGRLPAASRGTKGRKEEPAPPTVVH
jgi:hypothetical protein